MNKRKEQVVKKANKTDEVEERLKEGDGLVWYAGRPFLLPIFGEPQLLPKATARAVVRRLSVRRDDSYVNAYVSTIRGK